MALIIQDSAFAISELDSTGKVARYVTLRGAGLPFRGGNWGGKQRVSTTWYPGNAVEATQQTTGPIEKDSAFTGFWRTTQLTRNPAFAVLTVGGPQQQIVNAFTLSQSIESLFRSGSQLRVEWHSKGKTIVRDGRCADWDFKFDRMDDIEWTMSFEWSGRALGRAAKVASVPENNSEYLANLSANLLEAQKLIINQLNEARAMRLATVPSTFSLSQLENLIDAPNQIVQQFIRKAQQINNRIGQIEQIINKIRTVPFSMVNQFLDLAAQVKSTANNFVDQMSRRPPEENVAIVKFNTLTGSASMYGDAMAAARDITNKAVLLHQLAQAAKKTQQGLFRIHIAKQGETLVSISKLAYRSGDYAATIAKANGFPLNQMSVEPGTVLLIPTLAPNQIFNTTAISPATNRITRSFGNANG